MNNCKWLTMLIEWTVRSMRMWFGHITSSLASHCYLFNSLQAETLVSSIPANWASVRASYWLAECTLLSRNVVSCIVLRIPVTLFTWWMLLLLYSWTPCDHSSYVFSKTKVNAVMKLRPCECSCEGFEILLVLTSSHRMLHYWTASVLWC